MHITANDLTDPPEGIFDDISNSFDFSVFTYFQILKWSFWLLLCYCVIYSIPNLIFCALGDGNSLNYNNLLGLLNEFHFMLEAFSVANLPIQTSDTLKIRLIILIITDMLVSLAFFISIFYLSYHVYFQ